MSKTSELGFPALYRSLVAQPGQMQLFSPRAQPAAKPTPRADYYLYECEDSCECPCCQEEIYRGDEVVQTDNDLMCVECAIDSSTIPTT